MADKFNVLALSGGGYRGLFTAKVLAELEKATGKRIQEQFDLITGTSIGGILALALADGLSPQDVVELFKKFGSDIFPRPKNKAWYKLWSTKAFNRSLYDAEGLKRMLVETFGDRTMKDLSHAHVLIPAARASTGKPKLFKTPHDPSFYIDADIPIVDVALATSAAPVYFPMHYVKEEETRYIDGGLVGNAPGLFGYIEAHKRLGIRHEDISVLAVGTLSGKPCVSEKTSKRPWLLYWLNPIKPRLLELMFSIQEHQTHNMLNILLDKNYSIIDTTVSQEASNDIALDDCSVASQTALISRAIEETAAFTNTEFFKSFLKGVEDGLPK